MDAAAEKAKEDAETNEEYANFYRDMESVILKHNCIAYLLQDYLTTLGQKFTNGNEMENFQVYLNDNLDQYTALSKFMEQAFEWEIMDYTFYPYYWADRKQWKDMYLSESVDPLFRSFLQAGMARVIVTVKPGFEDAVQFFLATGLTWNGGEIPVIGDPLYKAASASPKDGAKSLIGKIVDFAFSRTSGNRSAVIGTFTDYAKDLINQLAGKKISRPIVFEIGERNLRDVKNKTRNRTNNITKAEYERIAEVISAPDKISYRDGLFTFEKKTDDGYYTYRQEANPATSWFLKTTAKPTIPSISPAQKA